jgi:hypothetical protein
MLSISSDTLLIAVAILVHACSGRVPASPGYTYTMTTLFWLGAILIVVLTVLRLI